MTTIDIRLAETTLFAGGSSTCSALTARAAFRRPFTGEHPSSTCAAGASGPARASSPAYLSSGAEGGHRRLIALVGADGLTLDPPAIDGGFAAWRDAGMPVG